MTRRAMPDRIALNLRLPRGEWGYWDLIRAADRLGNWTVPEIDGGSCGHRDSCGSYVRRLVKAGFAKVVTAEKRHNRDLPKAYRLLKSPAVAPRIRADGTIIVATAQECLWTAMRTLRTFTVRELAFAAKTEGVKVTEAIAQRYVEMLANAGYVVIAQERRGKFGLHTWRLKPLMNTGPLSPTILRAEAIYDRNLRKVMGDAIADREVAA